MKYCAINSRSEVMWAYTLEALEYSVKQGGGPWTIYQLVPVK